ncbi:MAG: putative sulfate exporter family transporter [Flavobacteriales bacterium]
MSSSLNTGQYKSTVVGLLVVAVLAVISILAGSFNHYLGAATIALILGAVVGNLFPAKALMAKGFELSEKKVLELAIVLLGFGISSGFFHLTQWHTWAWVFGAVAIVILLAFALGRLFGLNQRLSLLIGAGSAICGSAAIGAISPLINGKEEETALSIGIINLLGTIGLILFPILAVFFEFHSEDAGLMIGGVLQSMGHVIGAGYAVNEEVGSYATLIKMGRVTLIIPIILILFFIGQKRNGSMGHEISFPYFVPLFVLALVITQIGWLPEKAVSTLAKIGDYLLIGAMVGIGYKIRLKELFRQAGPALVVGLLVFLIHIGLLLVYVNIAM